MCYAHKSLNSRRFTALALSTNNEVLHQQRKTVYEGLGVLLLMESRSKPCLSEEVAS